MDSLPHTFACLFPSMRLCPDIDCCCYYYLIINISYLKWFNNCIYTVSVEHQMFSDNDISSSSKTTNETGIVYGADTGWASP